MNIQTKLIVLPVTRFANAYCGVGRLMLAGLLVAGLVHPALAVESATPVTATETNCQQAAMDVNQGIKSRMPADPEVAQVILNLKHQGDELCHNGSSESGQNSQIATGCCTT